MATPTSRGLGEGTCDWPLGHLHKTIRKKERMDTGQGVGASTPGTKPQLSPLCREIWMPLKELPGGVRPTGEAAPLQSPLPSPVAVAHSTRLPLIPQPA